ncbi:hypothetical protein I8748_25185 [Nostoc sp. CENA67]|uniref:Uncharacterized protein n=1 Tax=Amazonocrinis nigriterrae CENA67 TaxID=2794033 RepID=A0A8J7L9C6_9NOST|nr:hypothetical protein [Amazonocrinis nigriterrae]MBH8565429.1 hypothetical protein [Amazonocrinis nigriterrae CENA67]
MNPNDCRSGSSATPVRSSRETRPRGWLLSTQHFAMIVRDRPQAHLLP